MTKGRTVPPKQTAQPIITVLDFSDDEDRKATRYGSVGVYIDNDLFAGFDPGELEFDFFDLLDKLQAHVHPLEAGNYYPPFDPLPATLSGALALPRITWHGDGSWREDADHPLLEDILSQEGTSACVRRFLASLPKAATTVDRAR